MIIVDPAGHERQWVDDGSPGSPGILVNAMLDCALCGATVPFVPKPIERRVIPPPTGSVKP